MVKLFLFASVIILFTDCRTMKPIEGQYDNSPRRFYYTGDSLFNKVIKSLQAQNAKITDEDPISITAELHNTKWSWEKNGKPDNENAYVVIKRYYDIGAKKLYKPIDVITTWKISTSQEKNIYFIKLVDAVANYRSVHYVSEHHAGATLGNFEKLISETIK